MPILGYHQIPTEVWYNNTKDVKQYKTCIMPGVKEDPECSDSVKADLPLDHLHYLGLYTGCGLISSAEEDR